MNFGPQCGSVMPQAPIQLLSSLTMGPEVATPEVLLHTKDFPSASLRTEVKDRPQPTGGHRKEPNIHKLN
jgi:hypothetical protein